MLLKECSFRIAIEVEFRHTRISLQTFRNELRQAMTDDVTESYIPYNYFLGWIGEVEVKCHSRNLTKTISGGAFCPKKLISAKVCIFVILYIRN